MAREEKRHFDILNGMKDLLVNYCNNFNECHDGEPAKTIFNFRYNNANGNYKIVV